MLKTIWITSKDKFPLNEVVDPFLEKAGEQLDDLEAFELIVGKATPLGSGAEPVLKIRITAKIDQSKVGTSDKLDTVLTILKSIAEEIDFALEFEER